MNWNRRSFLAASAGSLAAMSAAKAGLASPTPVAGPNQFEHGDLQLVGISPDGTTVVGRDGQQLVFLNIDSQQEISRTSETEAIAQMHIVSISWSPDGSKLAFSLDTWIFGVDSDIFVVDVASGEVTNITDEDGEGEPESIILASDYVIDAYPVWINDQTLMFHRLEGPPLYDPSSTSALITSNADGSGVETWADIMANDMNVLYAPFTPISDGRVLALSDTPADFMTFVLALLDEHGGAEPINIADIAMPMLLAANDSHCFVQDREHSVTWYVPYDNVSEKQTIAEVMGFAENEAAFNFPQFGPEPNTFVALASSADTSVLLYDNGDVRELATIAGTEFPMSCHWVGNRILITGKAHSWIIDLD